MGCKVKFTKNQKTLNQIHKDANKALLKAGDAVLSDLINSDTLPYDSGNLQNNTFLDDSNLNNGELKIVSSTPYARRLYFGNDFNFDKSKHSNAGSNWFQPYIDGEKKDLFKKAFEDEMKKKL